MSDAPVKIPVFFVGDFQLFFSIAVLFVQPPEVWLQEHPRHHDEGLVAADSSMKSSIDWWYFIWYFGVVWEICMWIYGDLNFVEMCKYWFLMISSSQHPQKPRLIFHPYFSRFSVVLHMLILGTHPLDRKSERSSVAHDGSRCWLNPSDGRRKPSCLNRRGSPWYANPWWCGMAHLGASFFQRCTLWWFFTV